MDCQDFVKAKKDTTKINGANISIRLSDEFLKAVKENKEYEQRFPVDSTNPKISQKVKAKEIWNAIIENAHAAGEPGLLFWDTILKESPADCYSELGFRSISTNPCLTGDTLIKTDEGDISIKEIIENGFDRYKIYTYNTDKSSIEKENIVRGDLTKKDTDIIEIETEDGEKIELTPDHKVYTRNRGYIEASFLDENDIILKIENK